MDLLQLCAQRFDRLCAYQYHFVIGRKGHTIAFDLSFRHSDFHHLVGLHKLKDAVRFQDGRRAVIMERILRGRLSLQDAKKSQYYPKMEERMLPLLELEAMLDNNEIIFRYDKEKNRMSLIEADFLLENTFKEKLIYLFLIKRSGDDTHVCCSLFPFAGKDYTKGQTKYTLLYKEKRNLRTGEAIVQYDKLSLR